MALANVCVYVCVCLSIFAISILQIHLFLRGSVKRPIEINHPDYECERILFKNRTEVREYRLTD